MVNLLDYLVIDFITFEMFHHLFISIIQLFQCFCPFPLLESDSFVLLFTFYKALQQEFHFCSFYGCVLILFLQVNLFS